MALPLTLSIWICPVCPIHPSPLPPFLLGSTQSSFRCMPPDRRAAHPLLRPLRCPLLGKLLEIVCRPQGRQIANCLSRKLKAALEQQPPEPLLQSSDTRALNTQQPTPNTRHYDSPGYMLYLANESDLTRLTPWTLRPGHKFNLLAGCLESPGSPILSCTGKKC